MAEDGGICVSFLLPNPTRAQSDLESSGDKTDSCSALVASTTVVSGASEDALRRSLVDSLVSERAEGPERETSSSTQHAPANGLPGVGTGLL